MIVDGIRWKRVEQGSPETLPEDRMMRVHIGGRAICLVRNGGKLHALLDRCPHQGSSFIGGWCEGGKVLWEERVDLHAAKISTLGERAEDVFYVTDRAQQPLNEAAAEGLRSRLADALDQRVA